jgi:hypothetical protein
VTAPTALAILNSLAALSAPPAPKPPPGLAQTFGLIIGGLRRAIAARITTDRSLGPLISLICGQLERMANRFAALVARVEAGTLRPPRRRPARPTPPGEGPLPERPPSLPRKYAWLIRLVPYEAAGFASQLQHQLATPEMQALIEAAPQAGRILRPLCRLLLIPVPAALQLPPRPPRPKRPRPKRPEPDPSEPQAKPRSEPYRRRPTRSPGEGYVWRRWRDIWMPEPVRTPKPA